MERTFAYRIIQLKNMSLISDQLGLLVAGMPIKYYACGLRLLKYACSYMERELEPELTLSSNCH